VSAAERLGELGWLAIADAVCHLAHRHFAPGQHFSRPIHAHGGQVLAKSCVADLCERSLELAPRRRDAVGKVIERQFVAVLEFDDRGYLLVEL
jgi:hypothetical protein